MLQKIFFHTRKKFLINTHTKIGAKITDIIVFRKKLLKFLQGDNVVLRILSSGVHLSSARVLILEVGLCMCLILISVTHSVDRV